MLGRLLDGSGIVPELLLLLIDCIDWTSRHAVWGGGGVFGYHDGREGGLKWTFPENKFLQIGKVLEEGNLHCFVF